jgi:hypothetical protein
MGSKPFLVRPPISELSKADVRHDICCQALALAQRADSAGLTIAAYLLDMAALEIGHDAASFSRLGPRRGREQRYPGNDEE